MSTDIFANFSVLDELIQVIYQSIYKFVVVSTVTDDRWTIYLGQSDSAGRWWKGSWTADDVHDVLGAKASDKLLEQFADQLEKLFVDGELYINNWNSAPGTKIGFTLGPAAKKPMHISLEEMSPSQAAEFATGILLDIALQAQSRKCRLHGGSSGPSFQPAAAPNALGSRPTLEASQFLSTGSSWTSISHLPDDRPPESVEVATNYNLQEQPHDADIAQTDFASLTGAEPAVAPIPRPHKGASLANPSKKARKYQAIEFESDSE